MVKCFFECVDLCIDKPIVIIKPTVAIARLLSLGLKLYISILVPRAPGFTLDQETTGSGDENGMEWYPSNKQRMLNKIVTRLRTSGVGTYLCIPVLPEQKGPQIPE